MNSCLIVTINHSFKNFFGFYDSRHFKCNHYILNEHYLDDDIIQLSISDSLRYKCVGYRSTGCLPLPRSFVLLQTLNVSSRPL